MSVPSGYPTPSQPPVAPAGWPAPGSVGTGADPVAPAVPSGPGAYPPFVAPPVERDRKRFWLSLILGGLLVLTCCGGGIAAVGALGVATSRALANESRHTVTTYLSDLRSGDYAGAYAQLCADRTHELTKDQYAAQEQEQARPVSFTLDQPQISGTEVDVLATVELSDGRTTTITYRLVRDDAAGPLKICGAS